MAHALFMQEPPHKPNHRANVLDARMTRIGIGIVRDAAGYLAIVENFRLP